MGLQSTASAAAANPTGGVAFTKQGSSGDVYTVPAGKYFVGIVYGSSYQYGFRIDSCTFSNNGSNSTVNPPYNLTLYAGQVVSSPSSSAGTISVAGVEYDL